MQRGSGATLVFLRLVTGEAGRTTVAGKVAYETVVRSVGRNLDLSSVDVVELPRLRSGGAHRRAEPGQCVCSPCRQEVF